MNRILNVLLVFFIGLTMSFGQNIVPNDWYYGDPGDGYMGISMKKAYDEFLKGRKTQTVVVAIIDSGIDIDHEDLKDNIWVNTGEIPGNGIDDDRNGYVDDVHGWNFIGGADGQNVGPDTYEATRVYGALKYKYENALVNKLNKAQKEEYALYERAKEKVDEEREKAVNTLKRMDDIEDRVMNAMDSLSAALGDNELTLANLQTLGEDSGQEVAMGKALATQFIMGNSEIKDIAGLRKELLIQLDADRKRYQDKLDYAFNPDFDPRKTIVKDNYNDPNERYYGNNDVMGPDALHGTHVAGIVGAVRNNGIGNDGVAADVRLMSVRAVPDGDERDKDIANSIRYAVDNGASIINMSFGKGFGTHKDVVDEAVKYAEKKDVLLVHAAGNDAKDNDVIERHPTPTYQKKSGFLFFKKTKRAKNWIEVGALNYKQGEDYPAPFSNYGEKEVDLFAPGMQIYSTLPGDEYANLQGTSMASPVVAGVAAVIRSAFPALTAVQVKEAIMKSVTPIDEIVKKPGSKSDKVAFSKLSVSGGVVNLYNALQYASTMKGKKKIKKKGA